MKKKFYYAIMALSVFTLIYSCSGKVASSADETGLKDALKGKFYIGTALNTSQITEQDTAGVRLLKQHFNAIVAENCMKSIHIHPEEGRYDFTLPDQFVALGEKNNMWITGHTLIWHSQLSRGFCTDEKGNNVSAEVLKQRMKDHISTVVGRYKGRIKGWDVVNEAILEDGSLRNSKFYQILGEEFLDLAFQYANEADPDAQLYYNDYNEWYPGKRDAIVKMIRRFKEKGIRIDGIGMQGHFGMDSPSLEEYEAAIQAYTNEGVQVMVTELDLSILPLPDPNIGAEISTSVAYQESLNPYVNGVPAEKMQEWTNRMAAFFDLFMKYQDKMNRVTLWGITDGDSWKNGFPVRGRTDYPLLFDRNHQAKPIVKEIIDRASQAK